MIMKTITRLGITLLLLIASVGTHAMNDSTNPTVTLETNKGNIVIELYADKAPKTVANFLQYAEDGFYDGTIFHRVIPNFMIQGGGFTEDMTQKDTRGEIENEANNGLPNVTGSIAMARTPNPHSATAQFFINVKDNDFLNFSSETQQGWGYCVFGQVVEGMDVVKQIEGVKTGRAGMHQDVPVEPVIINKAVVSK
jgi:peptidyl-prolyl cis-trans isomerase B (cyclophilin B)